MCSCSAPSALIAVSAPWAAGCGVDADRASREQACNVWGSVARASDRRRVPCQVLHRAHRQGENTGLIIVTSLRVALACNRHHAHKCARRLITHYVSLACERPACTRLAGRLQVGWCQDFPSSATDSVARSTLPASRSLSSNSSSGSRCSDLGSVWSHRGSAHTRHRSTCLHFNSTTLSGDSPLH